MKFHATGTRAKHTGMQWKERERAGAGIRESARVDSILWMNGTGLCWPMVAYAGFGYAATGFSPTE